MSRAAESTHWYATDGSPAYTVLAKNGEPRPTTLRDARKSGYLPSVTTIIRAASAPGLERWKINQAILAALTLPKIEGETSDAYIDRILRDSQEQAKKAAERGTAIHAAIEGHFEGIPPHEDLWPFVKGAVACIKESCGEQQWSAEKSFASSLGYGGKVDLHSPEWVCDFKTKEFGLDSKLDTWDEHAMQLAAYKVGLGVPNSNCAIVYVSTTVPGLAKFCKIGNIQQGWEMFHALMRYWQAKTGYTPPIWRMTTCASGATPARWSRKGW